MIWVSRSLDVIGESKKSWLSTLRISCFNVSHMMARASGSQIFWEFKFKCCEIQKNSGYGLRINMTKKYQQRLLGYQCCNGMLSMFLIHILILCINSSCPWSAWSLKWKRPWIAEVLFFDLVTSASVSPLGRAWQGQFSGFWEAWAS